MLPVLKVFRKKNHPLGQASILTQHDGVQIWTVETRAYASHTRGHHSDGPEAGSVRPSHCPPVHGIAIPAQDLGESTHKAPFIINHQNPHRRIAARL